MRFRRRRFGRRRRYYRKRRGGWRRRYRIRRWRPRRRWRVRRWRRSVFRRGGRRARPYRITAWNPRIVRNCVITGWWPMIQCMEGMEYMKYKPMDLRIESNWIYFKSTGGKISTEQMGYLLQYGGGWSTGTISLEGLFNENKLWRNLWSKSNDGMDLVRYFGCKLKMYPTERQDYIFWYDTEFDQAEREMLDDYTQPSVMLQAKNSRLIVSKIKMPVRRKVKSIFIPPPSQLTTQWKFQQELCNFPLFNWACVCIDMDTPFDYNGAWRNAWWLMRRLQNGNMEYIERWGRIPMTGDTELPDSGDFKAGAVNPNFKPSGIQKIYPIVAVCLIENAKRVVKWATIHNKPLNMWRKKQASLLNLSNLRGLVLRVCSPAETYYKWVGSEFTAAFKQDWWSTSSTTYQLCTINMEKENENPTVEVWDWNSTVPQTGVLKDYFQIAGDGRRQWQDADFAKLQLPRSSHNVDFGHKARFGPFCVKRPPVEFREFAPNPLNIWVKYKFFFQFGGMYQPPQGVQDPCTSNPAYPVRMVGAITHPKYAGQGGITTQIGAQGITSASLRAISAAPPKTYTQSAFLKDPEREETPERESSSDITSAESSSEGDGSSEDEAVRRAARKRLRKLLLQRQSHRSLDNKRQRFSE
uniref:Capsid protein n=3 Tax=Torque teno sus virus 1a TaxID=687386 RepID=A0A7G8LJ35_9VIRU|nr:VP1 [Torque teno sus virus 1a]